MSKPSAVQLLILIFKKFFFFFNNRFEKLLLLMSKWIYWLQSITTHPCQWHIAARAGSLSHGRTHWSLSSWFTHWDGIYPIRVIYWNNILIRHCVHNRVVPLGFGGGVCRKPEGEKLTQNLLCGQIRQTVSLKPGDNNGRYSWKVLDGTSKGSWGTGIGLWNPCFKTGNQAFITVEPCCCHWS